MKPAMIKAFLKQTVEMPLQRAYSIEGLSNYINIDPDTFSNYSNKEGYETYFGICTRIRKIIDDQHFTGGMAGTFNAGIVTRKLGLAEKKEVDLSMDIPLFPDID